MSKSRKEVLFTGEELRLVKWLAKYYGVDLTTAIRIAVRLHSRVVLNDLIKSYAFKNRDEIYALFDVSIRPVVSGRAKVETMSTQQE